MEELVELFNNLPTKEASVHLKERHGIQRKPSTLAKLRCVGGGPRFRRDGRLVVYPVLELDTWAREQLSPLVALTAELDSAVPEATALTNHHPKRNPA